MIDLPVVPGRSTIDDPVTHGHKSPFKHIEIEINTACDTDCFGCDRFSDLIVTPNMTLEQVKLFVDESLEIGWEWERIRLLGGEPTLHPHFMEMVDEIIRYRRKCKAGAKCFLQVLSNGMGKYDKYKEGLLNVGVDIHVEGKQKGITPAWFANTRIVPLDRDVNLKEVPPCGIFGARGCGIGLTRNGYFMDGAGSAIARVAGYDIGVMSLKDLTWEKMMEQSKILCRVCGHWNPNEGSSVTKLITETGKVTGAFWTKTLAKYKSDGPPKMKIYGKDR